MQESLLEKRKKKEEKKKEMRVMPATSKKESSLIHLAHFCASILNTMTKNRLFIKAYLLAHLLQIYCLGL